MQTTKFLATMFLMAAIPAAGVFADGLDQPHVFSAAASETAQPARTGVCLKVRDIQDSSSKDGKILTFKMKDGTIYNNHLRQNCNSLIFGGFTWTVPSTEEICEDVQTLKAFTTGEICRLGRFDPPIKKTAAAR